jgi:hypothetical protein
MLPKEDMVTNKITLKIEFKNNNQLPYIAVELFQISKTTSGFALSCYPLDYQAIANKQPHDSTILIETTPVFNMILSTDALERLIKELNALSTELKE